MRNRKIIIYWILAFSPLFIVLLMLPDMPEKVPMHYNLSGEITRLGSKYELLILPVITLATSVILHFLGYYSSKKSERGKQNQKILFACGQIISICFCILSATMAFYTRQYAVNIVETHAYQIIAFVLSIMLILMGNLLPKCKRSENIWLSVGFRTPWTLINDDVWSKTNRIGGYLMFATGIMGIILSLILPGMWGFMSVFALLILVAVGGTVYSWKLYHDLKTLGHSPKPRKGTHHLDPSPEEPTDS